MEGDGDRVRGRGRVRNLGPDPWVSPLRSSHSGLAQAMWKVKVPKLKLRDLDSILSPATYCRVTLGWRLSGHHLPVRAARGPDTPSRPSSNLVPHPSASAAALQAQMVPKDRSPIPELPLNPALNIRSAAISAKPGTHLPKPFPCHQPQHQAERERVGQ